MMKTANTSKYSLSDLRSNPLINRKKVQDTRSCVLNFFKQAMFVIKPRPALLRRFLNFIIREKLLDRPGNPTLQRRR